MVDINAAGEHFRHWAGRLLAHHRGGSASESEVFQTSTISALLDGVYDGEATVGEILRHGDFGLGTFNALDGEMVILDGHCYRVRADGTASRVDPSERTPFAAVTRFRTDFEFAVETPSDKAQVLEAVDGRIESPNLLYAVKVVGRFSELHTRTVMEQHQPYPPLTKATEGQAETRFTDVSGTLVGFRTPDFEQGISVAGYHLHFLDHDRTGGGHVLDFNLDHGKILVTAAAQLHLSLPTSGAFLKAQLSHADLDDQINKAEGGHPPK